MAKIRIGMSGWTFDGWKNDFYPKGLAAKKELEYASRKVNSIEVNGTFYALQKPHTFQKWYDETPEDFVFSIKAPQYITHVRRLKEVDEAVANFFASGIFRLKEKLGPILWQFPPNVALKDDRFEKFLKLLPYNSKSASELAKKHSEKMEGRNHVDVHADFPIRHAFEFRHASFLNPDFIELLRAHGVAIVFAHSGEKSPYTEDLTADFVYARMHGQEKMFKKGYTDKVLEWWSERVSLWSQGKQPADALCISSEKPKSVKRDAFIYFDTEAKEFAPYDALNLTKLLANEDSPKKKTKAG
ncbi:MAG: DUF72 domain-containing protein [Pseudobdellovibrionaceae bacterium]